MKLDVIIGNPPYNKGMSLDFINRGHDFSTMYLSMIVPAKWEYYNNNTKTQAETITNSGLRDKINPYIKQIVFYHATLDVFDIELEGGVMYFLDDHKQHQDCLLINKHSRYKSFDSEGRVRLCGVYSLINIINGFISTYGPYKKIDLPALDHRYIVATQCQYMDNGNDYGLLMWCPLSIIDTKNQSLGPYQVNLAQFDDMDGCKSFLSYIDRPLIKLLIDAQSISYNNWATNPMIWDLVPDPGPFDHIFTDEELYKKYNIPPQLQEDLGRLYKCRPEVRHLLAIK